MIRKGLFQGNWRRFFLGLLLSITIQAGLAGVSQAEPFSPVFVDGFTTWHGWRFVHNGGTTWGSTAGEWEVNINGTMATGYYPDIIVGQHMVSGSITDLVSVQLAEKAAWLADNFAVGLGRDWHPEGYSGYSASEARAAMAFAFFEIFAETAGNPYDLSSGNFYIQAWPDTSLTLAQAYLNAVSAAAPDTDSLETKFDIIAADQTNENWTGLGYANFLVYNPPCTPPLSGMVSWWGGDNNTLDMVGANNGTLMNGATFASGMVGQAFSFGGVEDYVSAADSATWDFGSGDFTINAWINTDSPNSLMRLISAGSHVDGANNLWTFGYGHSEGWGAGQRLNFAYYDGSGYSDFNSSEITIGAGTWNHIAVVRSGPSLQFYFNGAPAGSHDIGSVSMGGGSTGAIIGARYYTDAQTVIEFARGLIDEASIFNRALSASEIAAIYNAGNAGICRECTPPPSGMVSWWGGDNNALDMVGGNNGSLMGGATYGTGMVGQAFSFDGGNDYVSVPHSSAWNFGSNNFTLDLWVKFNAIKSNFLACHDEGSGNQNKWCLYAGDGYLNFHINSPGTGPISIGYGTVPFPYNTGQWYHLALTRNGNTYTFYVDGAPAGAVTDSNVIPDANAPLTIGQGEGVHYVNGLIDELEIFNRALSADEIAAIYNAGSEGKCAPDRTPDTFTFDAVTGAARSTPYTSDPIPVTGINVPVEVTIVGGYYSIGCTETFVNTEGTVVNGDTICVLQTSSGSYFTKTTASLTIGEGSADFEVTTLLSHTVQVVPSGTVSAGTSVAITSAPGGVACDWNGSSATGTCTSSEIGELSQVVLTAVLPAGTTIDWGAGCDSSTASTCTINSLTSNITISPVTTAQTFTITVTGAGVNGGTMIGGSSISATWDGSATGGTNSAHVIYGGGPVSVIATGNTGIYATWSGDCDSKDANGTGEATCTINAGLTADKNILASFLEYPVRRFTTVATGHYKTIQEAYDNAVEGEEIQAREADFPGDLNLNLLPTVTLRGGYNGGFASNGEYTTVGGIITFSGGPVTVERIMVQ